MSDHPEVTVHRMAEPAVRARVAALIAAATTIAWASVTLLGHAAGPFTDRELPDVAGLPIQVPQIQRLLPPQSGTLPEIDLSKILPQGGSRSGPASGPASGPNSGSASPDTLQGAPR